MSYIDNIDEHNTRFVFGIMSAILFMIPIWVSHNLCDHYGGNLAITGRTNESYLSSGVLSNNSSSSGGGSGGLRQLFGSVGILEVVGAELVIIISALCVHMYMHKIEVPQ